jgi:hypothetical protein
MVLFSREKVLRLKAMTLDLNIELLVVTPVKRGEEGFRREKRGLDEEGMDIR